MSTLAAPADHAVHRVARDHCLAPSRTVDAPTGWARYGRMFPHLAPLPADLPALETAGETGGVCDAAVLLARAGAASDDAGEAAGWPFFGQFVARDITADRSPAPLRPGTASGAQPGVSGPHGRSSPRRPGRRAGRPARSPVPGGRRPW
jgi:hypothetical protein